MKNTVFFDFDGTLADTAQDLVAATNLQRIRAGLDPLPFEALRNYASQGAPGLLGAALQLNRTDENYEHVRTQFLKDYYSHMTDKSVLFAGIPEMLDDLEKQGWQWGIVTNKAESLSFPLFKYFGLYDRSVANICGDTAARPKPYADPLLLAAERAGVNPEACIYAGDDERDIIAGKAAGMKTIAIAYGYCPDVTRIPAWGADGIAHSPEELLDWIYMLASK
ncbi:HAD family hydrolase [Pelistega europaea]|uniref:HAD-IA family hydrolase n=1 Tax=Pelistega europaea TaxID=106147 RepID=A0A7Y4LD44_9BURK|nr:HAD-IA family hydrolase [Pelistega europaea]NOL50226.1 HAD-IA family hydrolase [Pelistega europaea]